MPKPAKRNLQLAPHDEEKELQKLQVGAQILKLLDQAYNHFEILEITGIAIRRQKEIIKEYREKMTADIQDSVTEWRATAMERLEAVIKRATARAQDAQEERSRDVAEQNIIKAIQEQARVMGLDKGSTTNNTLALISNPDIQRNLKVLGYG
jgi:hypothetical protein